MVLTKDELIDGIKQMSVLDLAEVVKALEEEQQQETKNM